MKNVIETKLLQNVRNIKHIFEENTAYNLQKIPTHSFYRSKNLIGHNEATCEHQPSACVN